MTRTSESKTENQQTSVSKYNKIITNHNSNNKELYADKCL
jgi:hypothetical protein